MKALLILAVFSTLVVAEPVQIKRTAPTGNFNVNNLRQVVLTFNQKMVPLGEMKRTAKQLGVSVTPELTCDWHWLDPENLACELGDDNKLKMATKYTVTLNAGLKSQSGAKLEKEFTWSFSTEPPKSSYHDFRTWRGPSSPVIRVNFNVPVEGAALNQLAVFRSGGKTFPAKLYFDPKDKTEHEAIARSWSVMPAQPLPANSPAILTLNPGLKTTEGPLTSRKQDVVEFHTFPAFEFVGIECYPGTDGEDSSGGEPKIYEKTKTALCSPLNSISLLFTAPVRSKGVQELLKITPQLAKKGSEADVWPEQYDEYLLRTPYKAGTNYRVNMPSFLLAKKNYAFEISKALADEFGRPLAKDVKFEFQTSSRKPAMNVPNRVAVLEKEEKTEVPLYVTNIKTVNFNFSWWDAAGGHQAQTRSLKPAKVEDLSYAIPMEARALLNGGSGVAYGFMQSEPPTGGGIDEDDGAFFVQVTPFHVLAKLGHHNTTVWVTDMKTGKPVSDAKVELIAGAVSDLASLPEAASTAQTNGDGLATLKGRSELDPELKMRDQYRFSGRNFIVRVTRGKDVAFLPLVYQFGMSAGVQWDDERIEKKFGHIHAWGATAQGVYRVGDKVQFKIYVRDQDNLRFNEAPKTGYSLVVRDPTGNEAYKVEKISMNEFGAYSGEFTIAPTAPVGWYDFTLAGDFGEGFAWTPLRVLVSDFTPVPFKVQTELNGKRFGPGGKIKVSTSATMHSGGPYAKAPVRVNAQFNPQSFTVDDPRLQGFTFDTYEYGSSQIFENEAEVDAKGRNETTQTLGDLSHTFGTIVIESAVSDDRGKKVADSASAIYSGLDRRVGLKTADWVFEKGKASKLLYAVVDEDGKMTEGTKVSILFEREEIKVAKVKGAGNAYLNEYHREWIDTGKCEGKSGKDVLSCDFTPPESGEYRFKATIQDTKGRTHSVKQTAYVVGPGRMVWYEGEEGKPLDNFPIVPERKDYKVGDRAKFLVKNPLPGSLALITLERFGVMKSWTKKFDSSTEVIEVKLDKDTVPGFFLSVTLVSPRVEKAGLEGGVDLGKPAVRIGSVRVDVKDPYKVIEVSAKIPKETYRPRDKVKVRLKASVKNRDEKEPIELAVVVLDEAVLALIQGGASYYDPYKGFYTLDGLDLTNYNLLTRLVGRQKFEKKGASPGGDGGLGNDLLERSLFKFVSYWNPSLKTNSSGEADFEFTVPDNLTGWRVLAMAVTPTDRMGLGQKSFQVNKPTEIRPVMPNQVTEGDSFKAEFSVMNRTDKTRTVDVTITPSGNVTAVDAVSPVKVELKAFERKTVGIAVKAPRLEEKRDAPPGEMTFKVTAKDSVDGDALIHKMPVNKRRSLETAASYGTTEEPLVKEAIQFPKNIFPDVGQVSVTTAPSVIGDLDGSFRYTKNYPYMCWEQRVTKALMASHFVKLKDYIPTSTWDGAADLPARTVTEAKNFQAPNGGMTYWVPTDEHVDPYLSAYTGLAFLWLKDAGYKVPTDVESKLHGYLKTLLKTKAVPSFYDAGMESTTRAVVLYVLAKAKVIKGAEVRRFQPAMKSMNLFGRAHYLLAAIQTGENVTLKDEIAKLILSQANQTAGKFMFQDIWEDRWQRILSTPVRDNCAVLSAFVKYAATAEGKKTVGDVPFKLLRSLTQSRGARDHFENTQENIFCTQSFVDYAKVYEATAPDFKVTANLDGKKIGEGQFKKLADPLQTYSRPLVESDVGRKSQVTIEKKGAGRMYYATRVSFATKSDFSKTVNAGVDIKREYYVERSGKWIRLEDKAQVKRGELIRIEMFVSLPAARNFLVVNDPVPGGFEPVNRDLANTSKVDADKGDFKPSGGSAYFKFGDWHEFSWSFWSFYHKELRHDSARFYSDYLPPGNYRLSYTAQAISTGEFSAAPAKAEEMYDPDVYGLSTAATFTVNQ